MVKTNSIYKNIFICFFVLLFSHISLYNTPLKLLVFLLMPPVISYMIYKNGIIPTAMMCISSIVFNILTAIYLPVISGSIATFNTFLLLVPGFVCGVLISKKLKVLDVLLAVTISVIIFPLIMMAYAKYSANLNFYKEISNIIMVDFDRQFHMMKTLYPEISQFLNGNENELLSAMAVYIPGLMPCIAIIISTIYALIIFGFSKSLLKRNMINDLFFINGLDCIFIPRTVTFALVISLVLMFFETDSVTAMVAINIFLVTLMFYMLHGLSLIEYFLKQKNLNSVVRFISLAGIIILLMLASAFMPLLNPVFSLAFLGMTDSSSDFRKLYTNKDEVNEN